MANNNLKIYLAEETRLLFYASRLYRCRAVTCKNFHSGDCLLKHIAISSDGHCLYFEQPTLQVESEGKTE